MQLETIRINRFRSVDQVTLPNCGGFNVLIGKNNAGKSNILFAINLFFQALRASQSLVIFPAPTKAADHFREDVVRPISLTFDFKLSLAERDSLIQDIVSNAQQVKNAVEGLDPDLRLSITVACESSPIPFTYIKEIVLRSRLLGDEHQGSDPRALLRVDTKAAYELAERARSVRKTKHEIDTLREVFSRTERFEGGDWERVRSDPVRFMRTYTDASRASADVLNKVDRVIRSTETRVAAREALESIISGLEREIEERQIAPLQNRIDSISGKEEIIPPYALRTIEKLAAIKILFLRERREPIGQREAEQLLDLKVTRGGPEKLRAIQETVEALLGVEIDAFKASGSADSPAELDVDRFLVQGNGAGIREALRLILDYEFSQPDILLVEEPEVHLHPALEVSMMRYLKRTGRECQIFITTHSTNFLDTAEMRNVYLVSREQSSKVQLVDVAEAEAVIPRELGLRLSSLFMFEKLVFVEGPSDEDVIREWASVVEVNLAQASVGFVPMGGVRNLAHFATEKTLDFLTKRRVNMWFILDRDEREEQEIKRLASHLGDNAVLNVLARRELENYLTAPRALASFIEMKRTMSGVAGGKPSEEQVARALDESADSLKDVALERRIMKAVCVPYYVNRDVLLEKEADPFGDRLLRELRSLAATVEGNISRLPDLMHAITSSFQELWVANKLSLVPGDLLLDEVSKRFGVRFFKEKDSSRLASLMRPDEVAPEIRFLLEDIRDRKLKE